MTALDLGWIEDRIGAIDADGVRRIIPHRYPFLLIDTVLDLVRWSSAVGLKQLTNNDDHCNGNDPAAPWLPGTLIVEAMAQTGAVLILASLGAEARGKLVMLAGVENAIFHHPAVPGDPLHLVVRCVRRRGPVWKFLGRAEAAGRLLAEADVTAAVVDQANGGR